MFRKMEVVEYQFIHQSTLFTCRARDVESEFY